MEKNMLKERKMRVIEHILQRPYENLEFDVKNRRALQKALDYSICRVTENVAKSEDFWLIEKMADYHHLSFSDPNYTTQGEIDFVAIRLCRALHENVCYNQLSQKTQKRLKEFFIKEDYRSVHPSENHCLMFRVSLLLAAQFYKNEYMENYKMTAEECYEKDKEYVIQFLNYRAKYGWGEFDSLGYTAEVIFILATLHKYIDDERLRKLCAMALDIILVDMINDSIAGYYGGAHGRSYPQDIIHRNIAGMSQIYQYYFGEQFEPSENYFCTILYFCKYVPSKIVYDIAKKAFCERESFERKHLHLMSAWFGEEILWPYIAQCDQESINKYTYVCKDYALGAINHQDEYPQTISPSDRAYAHHQQHEWELTFPESELKIFSHHYSDEKNSYKINNRWTGDYLCCCGSFYANKNTLIAMYNIENREASDIINAYVPLKSFESYCLDEKYVFVEYDKLYIAVYFDNGYTVNDNKEDEFFEKELLSRGWQNAVVLRVKYKKDYVDFSAFMEEIKALPVVFDREARKVIFDNIILEKDRNFENGVENVYPYPEVYNSPFTYSIWGSGVIEIKLDKKVVVYDFNTVKIIEK